jgi:hypothetical protein
MDVNASPFLGSALMQYAGPHCLPVFYSVCLLDTGPVCR